MRRFFVRSQGFGTLANFSHDIRNGRQRTANLIEGLKDRGLPDFRIDPVLCDCGRKALYKVKVRGYCKKCKPVRFL